MERSDYDEELFGTLLAIVMLGGKDDDRRSDALVGYNLSEKEYGSMFDSIETRFATRDAYYLAMRSERAKANKTAPS